MVLMVSKVKSQSHSHSRGNGGAKGGDKRKGSCRNCGTSHPPRRCPAFGKNCHNCGIEGHYKALCRSHKQSTVGRMDKEGEDLNMKLNKTKAKMTGHSP